MGRKLPTHIYTVYKLQWQKRKTKNRKNRGSVLLYKMNNFPLSYMQVQIKRVLFYINESPTQHTMCLLIDVV